MDAVYFVASSEDGPEAIYFSSEDAFESAFLFIDSFDEEGTKILSYKLMDEDEFIQTTSEENYTTKF
jgi:hypothetical protein